MLSCEQFRFLAGAAPRELTPMLRLHFLLCRACSREYRRLQCLDQRIREALSSEPSPQNPDTSGTSVSARGQPLTCSSPPTRLRST
jgi:hypothetical protein